MRQNKDADGPVSKRGSMMFDHDYDARLELLWDLILASPDKPVRKLLQESLRYYPLHSQSLHRRWLSMRTAYACCTRFDPLNNDYEALE